MNVPIYHQLLVIGGGFRAVKFLASATLLRGTDIGVIERSDRVGPGAFSDYIGTSTSTADRFAAGMNASSELPRSRPVLESWSQNTSQRVPLESIGDLLATVGSDLEGTGAATYYTSTRATEIRLNPNGADVSCSDGREFRTSHVVVATGREERPHPALRGMGARVVLSSQFISRTADAAMSDSVRNLTGHIAVVGGSHSAMTAIARALALRDEVDRPDIKIIMIHRRGVRLHYNNLDEYYAEHNPTNEQPLDEVRDMCPETGQVNRDSGLRGPSRALWTALISDEIPNASVHREPIEVSDHIRTAGLVVQALGYRGRAPRIRGSDGAMREAFSDEPLYSLPDGSSSVRFANGDRLSVLRVEPTPPAIRDHATYGRCMNHLLSQRILRSIGDRG